MKLGAALTLRAYQAQKMAELRGRITANASVQEGDEPSEDPGKLMEEFEQVSAEHAKLVFNINRTNHATRYGEGALAQALQEREHKRRIKNTLEQAATAAVPSGGGFRYMRSEIKVIPKIDVAKARQRIDELTEEIRQIDADIQTVNWETDLIE